MCSHVDLYLKNYIFLKYFAITLCTHNNLLFQATSSNSTCTATKAGC